MSILCLDCGNTRLKWGLRAAGAWLAQDTLAYGSLAMPDLAPAPQRLVACNVAGEAGRAAVAALAARHGLGIEWVTARAQQCGVTNRYEPPEQLGADRWAALVGARALHEGACLVVNCGTATTVDILGADGVFHGGLILPGLAMMRSALADSTADLPAGRGDYRLVPTNTFDAIASGAIEATLGAVERVGRRVAATDSALLCLLSGGAAPLLAPHLDLPHRVVDNLVLEGVARIAAAL